MGDYYIWSVKYDFLFRKSNGNDHTSLNKVFYVSISNTVTSVELLTTESFWYPPL